uniref:E3 ubiquitin-protein ligase Rnf220-like isoform X1 n=1 Tax=Myxine glutinosa TaxID=7769 RepID=UPI00358F1E24
MREAWNHAGILEQGAKEILRMDLPRSAVAAFRMENSSYLPNPLTSPALMVLASTAEAARDPSRSFGTPVGVDKDPVHIPFTNGSSYAFASLYHRQAAAAYSGRDFPPHQLLHLHPQFTAAAATPPGLGLLGHSTVGAFRPFASAAEEREAAVAAAAAYHHSAFTPAKRLKGVISPPDSEGNGVLHLRFSDAEDFASAAVTPTAPQPPPRPVASPASLKLEEHGKMAFTVAGLVADRDSSPSPQEGRLQWCRKKTVLYDGLGPATCPVCQVALRPADLREHLEQEVTTLRQLFSAKKPALREALLGGISKQPSPCSSNDRRRDGELPSLSPISSEDVQLSDRYQTFLRVRANRQSRLNGPPVGRNMVTQMISSVNLCARIGKNKRKKTSEDAQFDGLTGHDDDDLEVEVERRGVGRFEDYEWCRQPRLPPGKAPSTVQGGPCSHLDNHDSDVDLDVDGDDTLDYGKPQYSETDVIPCGGGIERQEMQEPGTPRSTGNSGDASPGMGRIHADGSSWPADEATSSSHLDGDARGSEQNKGDESESDRVRRSEEAGMVTIAALKVRILELEKDLKREHKYKCLICMDCYSLPLTSIQCWHVHCEECWMRTLGAKKLCPQCNTITSPSDLRRIYL